MKNALVLLHILHVGLHNVLHSTHDYASVALCYYTFQDYFIISIYKAFLLVKAVDKNKPAAEKLIGNRLKLFFVYVQKMINCRRDLRSKGLHF